MSEQGATGSRPAGLVVVTGTGTEVGKTWVAAALLRAARAEGRRVAAVKPVQSHEPPDAASGRTDAHVLAEATGQEPHAVCPPHRWLGVPMAPPMAAAHLGLPAFGIADLVAEIRWPDPPPDVALVETAGGVRSPLAVDGDTVSLCDALVPDVVVLVADAGLGTVNATRLSVEALAAHRVVVLLNRYEPANALHRANLAWLAETDGLAVETEVDALLRRSILG